MNLRIRTLAEQATKHYSATESSGEFSTFDEQKFAQLIVTDVIDILTTYRTRVIFEDGFEYNCEHPINAISKHFRS